MILTSAGYYNNSQSIFTAGDLGTANFLPDQPGGGQTMDSDFNPVLWDLVGPDTTGIFDISPIDHSLLVCFLPGLYFVRATVSFEAAPASRPDMDLVLKKNPGPDEEILTWSQFYCSLAPLGSPAGYPQSIVAEVYVPMAFHDTLQASFAGSVAIQVLGKSQFSSSNFYVRRVGPFAQEFA